jgi:hypothetical protein
MPTALYFNSIDDMPLYNWRKCQEKGEYIYTRKNELEGTEEGDAKAWLNLYDGFLVEFGVNESYKEVLGIRQKIAILQCDIICGAAAQLNNQIMLLELRLEEILGRKVDSDMDSIIIHLERWRGIEVNEHKTSVRKFYKLLREYEKYVQEMKTKQALQNG